MKTLQLPEGWYYTPTMYAKPPCPRCGHQVPERVGELRSPSGRWWSLIGNRSSAQERQMVKAIVEANT